MTGILKWMVGAIIANVFVIGYFGDRLLYAEQQIDRHEARAQLPPRAEQVFQITDHLSRTQAANRIKFERTMLEGQMQGYFQPQFHARSIWSSCASSQCIRPSSAALLGFARQARDPEQYIAWVCNLRDKASFYAPPKWVVGTDGSCTLTNADEMKVAQEKHNLEVKDEINRFVLVAAILSSLLLMLPFVLGRKDPV